MEIDTRPLGNVRQKELSGDDRCGKSAEGARGVCAFHLESLSGCGFPQEGQGAQDGGRAIALWAEMVASVLCAPSTPPPPPTALDTWLSFIVSWFE